MFCHHGPPLILTGSSTPDDDPLRHSGAGRMMGSTMRPMTLSETADSSAGASLTALLRGEAPASVDGPGGLEDVASRLRRGGWPAWFGLDEPMRSNSG